MNIDFNVLNNSIGKRLKFTKNYKINGSIFIDEFFAELLSIDDDYIIVKQDYIEVSDNFEEILKTQKRKLIKGHFTIDTRVINLSH